MKPLVTPVSLLVFPALLAAPLPGTAQEALVSPQGEVRLRWESASASGSGEADVFTLLRTRLGVDVRFGAGGHAFAQVQDSRVLGEETSTLDGAAEGLDMHQAFLEMAWHPDDFTLVARAGRQEVALGSERLVGAVAWSNVGRSFDALRLTLAPSSARWSLSGFVATVRERGRALEGAPGEDDHTLLGLWAEGAILEGFLIQDLGARHGAFHDVDRTTVGGRAPLPAGLPIQGFMEGAWQVGSQSPAPDLQPSQDVSAVLLGARLWFPMTGRLRSLGAGLDRLSGDPDPSDGRYGAFNTLYATNHKFYGYLDLFTDPAAQTGDRGLFDGMLNARLALSRSLVLEADLHAFWFATARAGEERPIGRELDLTLPITLVAGPRVTLGYSVFRAGGGAALVGLGKEGDLRHWGYVQAGVSFGPGAPG